MSATPSAIDTCSFFQNVTRPSFCSSLWYQPNASVASFARWYHTNLLLEDTEDCDCVETLVTTWESSGFVLTASVALQSASLGSAERSCLPGPLDCDLTYSATACPQGYTTVSTYIGGDGSTSIPCCPSIAVNGTTWSVLHEQFSFSKLPVLNDLQAHVSSGSDCSLHKSSR